MPSNWNLGTITARFYWTANSSSGTVRWAMGGTVVSNDGPIDAAIGSSQLVDDTLLATFDMHITDFTPPITLAGTAAAGRPVFFQIIRSPAGDTLSADARLIGAEITYGTL
jgi:hypothetical protein